MFNHYELDEMLKDVLKLKKLEVHLKSKGKTIETATKEDFYEFIGNETRSKIDYYTGKPVTTVDYSTGMAELNDLIVKYRKIKVILTDLMENEVL